MNKDDKDERSILEPQIISFYNELPQYAIIIDNLNQEKENNNTHFSKIHLQAMENETDSIYESKYRILNNRLRKHI